MSAYYYDVNDQLICDICMINEINMWERMNVVYDYWVMLKGNYV